MQINEINSDLFEFYDQNKEYTLIQCISSDFKMGAGIAVEFNRRFNVKNIVQSEHLPNQWDGNGYALQILYHAPVINLVTKEFYYNKPTYFTLKESLDNLRTMIETFKIKNIAMPRIGCGLDRLRWEKVKEIIESSFRYAPVTIVVCNKVPSK